MIRALIFDFDGLMMDTEASIYDVWRSVFVEAGHDLPVSEWLVCVGTGEEVFDPFGRLARLTGRPVDRAALDARTRAEAREAASKLPPLPGVGELIAEADRRGIALAVASSSPRDWVVGHLERAGLLDRFATIRTRENVARTKPAPDLFLAALAELGVAANEAVVLEDSLNGLRAARAAGIPCIAVPNRITRELDFGEADAVLDSLLDFDARWFSTGLARKDRT